MCCRSKAKRKRRPPLKPREGPYKTVNAYTQKLCFEQILVAVLVVILLALHAIFIIPPIAKIDR